MLRMILKRTPGQCGRRWTGGSQLRVGWLRLGRDTHSSAASRFVGSRTLEKSSASATSEMNEMPLCINTHIEDALGVENGMEN